MPIHEPAEAEDEVEAFQAVHECFVTRERRPEQNPAPSPVSDAFHLFSKLQRAPSLPQPHCSVDARSNFVLNIGLKVVEVFREETAEDAVDVFHGGFVGLDASPQILDGGSLASDLVRGQHAFRLRREPFGVLLGQYHLVVEGKIGRAERLAVLAELSIYVMRRSPLSGPRLVGQ